MVDYNRTGPGAPDISGLYADLFKRYQTGQTKAEGLFGQGMTAMQRVADLFAPGGAYEQQAMGQYETGKQKYLSGAMQNLISSGLGKTSTPAALERGYEQEVGTPFRTAMTAESQGRLASALQNMAQFGMQYPQLYPSPGTLSYLATGGFGALSASERGWEQLRAAQDMVSGQQPTSTTTPTQTTAYTTGGLSGGSPFAGWQSLFGDRTNKTATGQTATPTDLAKTYGQAGEMMMGGEPEWQKEYWTGQFGVPSTADLLAGGQFSSDLMQRTLGTPMGSNQTAMKIMQGNDPSTTRTIQVAAGDLGSGPGGFKDKATYLKYMPSGWQTYKA